MFKEALAGFFLLFLFFLLSKSLYKKSRHRLTILIFCALGISCIANIVYNVQNTFPNFYMDTVTGSYRYGTFSGNLFAYSDEFMFQDNILFPILKNRTVALDASAGFYEKFISLYAEDYDFIEISDSSRDTLLTHVSDFDFSHEFSCIGIMDYAKEEIPPELVSSFDEDIYPWVYIHTDSLEGQKQLVCIMDSDYSFYVMGKDYYTTVTGDSDYE